MSVARSSSRPVELCIRHSRVVATSQRNAAPTRHFSKTAAARDDGPSLTTAHSAGGPTAAEVDVLSAGQSLDPNTAAGWRAEVELARAGTPPIGSRRRRVALQSSQNIPFEQLPYQCFQEARKIIAADREEKLGQIAYWSAKIKEVEAADAATFTDGERSKRDKLSYMRFLVERLKIRADINDPLVKRKFEDGLGDMNKPVYRHLARRRWESYDRKLIEERVSQFHIVPDVLPKFEPRADVKLFFKTHKIRPGDFVDSLISETPPRLRLQVFDAGQRLLTIVVMDSDVPSPETDGFARRCHFIAANIPWSPTDTSLPLGKVSAAHLAVPWLPPVAQKGAPYHRLSIFVLEQASGETLDMAKLQELYSARDGFSLKSFRDKFKVTPVGFNIFRSTWDDNTAAVMERCGIPGADIEFKRQRIHSLKTPRKARGWEAKRQSAKWRSLWKYTKRLA